MEYKKINELTTVVTGGTPSTRKNEYWIMEIFLGYSRDVAKIAMLIQQKSILQKKDIIIVVLI